MSFDAKIYLRRNKAAEYLYGKYGVGTEGTLAKLACIGGGPPYQKLGRYPVYTPEDLDAWAESRMSRRVSSTSELIVVQTNGGGQL